MLVTIAALAITGLVVAPLALWLWDKCLRDVAEEIHTELAHELAKEHTD